MNPSEEAPAPSGAQIDNATPHAPPTTDVKHEKQGMAALPRPPPLALPTDATTNVGSMLGISPFPNTLLSTPLLAGHLSGTSPSIMALLGGAPAGGITSHSLGLANRRPSLGGVVGGGGGGGGLNTAGFLEGFTPGSSLLSPNLVWPETTKSGGGFMANFPTIAAPGTSGGGGGGTGGSEEGGGLAQGKKPDTSLSVQLPDIAPLISPTLLPTGLDTSRVAGGASGGSNPAQPDGAFKGIQFDQERGKWQVVMTWGGGRSIVLGEYADELEALVANELLSPASALQNSSAPALKQEEGRPMIRNRSFGGSFPDARNPHASLSAINEAMTRANASLMNHDGSLLSPLGGGGGLSSIGLPLSPGGGALGLPSSYGYPMGGGGGVMPTPRLSSGGLLLGGLGGGTSAGLFLPSQDNNNQRTINPPRVGGSYKGVRFNRDKQQWQAFILDGESIHWLGFFDDEGDAARAHDAEALRRFGPLAADLNFHMDDSPAEMVHQHHLSYHGLFQGQPSSTLVGDVGGVGSGMNLLSSIPHNLNLGGMNTNGAGLWIPQGVEEDLDEDGLVQMHPPTSGGRRQTGGTPGGGRGRAKGRGRGRAKVESDPSASEGGGSEDSWDGSSGGRGRGNASARRVVASSRGKKRPNKDWGEDIEAKGRSYAPPPHVLSSNGHPLVAKVVSKFKGVTWDDGSSKWQAQVYEGGLMVNLGLFETQEEAARAYDASIVRSGRKERLNFPANHVRDPTSISKKSRATSGHKITSQYKGVSWNSACSKWVAVLWDRELKRARHIGSYESEEDAARAFDREAIKMLGTEAGLNFRESLDDYMATNGGMDADGDWGKVVSRKASNPTPAPRAPPHPDPPPSGKDLARGNGRRQVKRRRMDEDFIVDDDEEELDEGEEGEEDTKRKGATRPVPPAQSQAVHSQAGSNINLASGPGVAAVVSSLPSVAIYLDQPSGKWAAALVVAGSPNTVLGHCETEAAARSLAHGSLVMALAPAVGQGAAVAMASAAMTKLSTHQPQHNSAPNAAAATGSKVEADEGDAVEGGDADDPDYSLEDDVSYEEERAVEGGKGKGGGGGGGGAVKGKRGSKAAGEVGAHATTLIPGGNPTNRGKSLFRGVSWCEKVKKWRALLWDGHKQRFLGHFTSDSEAARAYDRALVDLKGQDAKTNFPMSDYV